MRLYVFLQHRDAAVDLARNAGRGVVFDHIIIDVVVVDLAVHLAVPAEILAGGVIDDLAPSVVDADVEHRVADVVVVSLRDAELVVDAVAVGREGVREQNLMLAGMDGVGSRNLAGTLRCRDRVSSFFKDRYDG